MRGLTRDLVVTEALELLDEVGLDHVSTRALSRRLHVEQPTLYYHFRDKAALLSAMASAAMEPLSTQPLPRPGDDWQRWFVSNTRSFRDALLLHRDGARLHAGSRPEGDSLDRAVAKFDFLVGAGLPRQHAQTATLSASWFTVGCVLEQQADLEGGHGAHFATTFEAGLALIVGGLAQYHVADTETD